MDPIDLAQSRQLEETERAIRQAAKPLEPGTPGECDLCGKWSGRLIGGACAPCRDHYRLP